jgi:hypothetical protein
LAESPCNRYSTLDHQKLSEVLLDRSEKLLSNVIADTVIAHREYHTDQYVSNWLQVQGKIPVIPPHRKPCNPRADDRDFYKAHQGHKKLIISTEAVSGDYDTFV